MSFAYAITYILGSEVGLLIYMLLSDRGYIGVPCPQPTMWEAMRSVCSRGISVSKETTCKLPSVGREQKGGVTEQVLKTETKTKNTKSLTENIPYLFMGETACSSVRIAGLQLVGREEISMVGLSYSSRAE